MGQAASNVFRGLSFSCRATAFKCFWLCSDKSVPFVIEYAWYRGTPRLAVCVPYDSILMTGLWCRLPLLVVGLAELGWRHTLPALESLGKVLGIGEAAVLRDLLDAYRGVEKEIFCDSMSFRIQQRLVAGIVVPQPSSQSPG